MTVEFNPLGILPPQGVALEGKRVLVTGHRGFIGRRLTRQLERHGATVLCFHGDVRDPHGWREDFDIAYHLAAATPFQFEKLPAEAFDVNLNGVLRSVEACSERGAHLIFTSSCSVYAPCESRPVRESDELQPKGLYGTSKLIGEMLCRTYAQEKQLRCTFFRLFNAFGPGQSSIYLIPYLIDCACKGTPAAVRHPYSIRDFVHVNDVVTALVAATAGRSFSWNVFNLGSGQVRTVRQVIEALGTILGRPVSFEVMPAQPDSIPVLYADTSKLCSELGWFPRVSFEAGLEELLRMAML